MNDCTISHEMVLKKLHNITFELVYILKTFTTSNIAKYYVSHVSAENYLFYLYSSKALEAFWIIYKIISVELNICSQSMVVETFLSRYPAE